MFPIYSVNHNFGQQPDFQGKRQPDFCHTGPFAELRHQPA
jgi:hypothetical protein